MNNSNLERYREILEKHSHKNVSDEELLEILGNIEQFVDVVSAYERRKETDDI